MISKIRKLRWNMIRNKKIYNSNEKYQAALKKSNNTIQLQYTNVKNLGRYQSADCKTMNRNIFHEIDVYSHIIRRSFLFVYTCVT